MDNQSIRMDMNEEDIIRFENWLKKHNDERVIVYEALPSGEYVSKCLSDPGFDKIKSVEKIIPCHLGIFVLTHSKRNRKTIFHEIDVFF